tara:strand:- start:1026 stop:1373 length:348 start_codon:yes stop_codon:yes gene_type:complete
MKKIYSDTYNRKNAQYSLPGDPNLPPGVSNKDIDDAAGGQPLEGQKKVEWITYDASGGEIPVIVVFDYIEWEGQQVEINITSVVNKLTKEYVLDLLPDESVLNLEKELAESLDNI